MNKKTTKLNTIKRRKGVELYSSSRVPERDNSKKIHVRNHAKIVASRASNSEILYF
jgi:hypothetical protein